uniref:Embryogenesis-associated protein emb8-like n=1 Tax=Tetraselmis sp. GSL018 TaxID=582737 RepID=A0A061RI67_9CHLO|mmetsp:Transcript_13013/g.30864  ORF Transcript_13013/g.30864 Transcript_13013/m.30864 type:complete len:331 (+) Transcript_13013:746-1738(+)
MKDRVKVALDWCPADQANYPEDSPVVLCLHGIGCSSQGKSVRLLMEECLKRGWRGVVYNRRGHGGTSIAPESDEDDDNSSSDIGMDSSLDDSCTSKDEPGRALAKMFPEHADVDDMADVVRHIARKHPAARIVCVGFSLGSNLLLRYLGHMRERSGIFAGVSIANGFDLVQGTRNLKERSPVMDAIVVSKLKRLVRANSEHIIRAQRLEDQHLQGLMRARSVRDFDDVIAKPLYGYESVDEYYEQSSCVAMLKDICSPVLCITDQDDPLISSDLLKHPLDAGRVNHNLLTVLTRTGGHLGWLEGWKGKSWVIKACGQYIEAVLAEECPLP